ncbi:MAG: protein-L-isoaspartate O-methyltransferase [Alphaproteobacteria bacterium CG_4_10_14_0_2_um_filter_63_37]|nr:MAG: hypothetical protein AUJ55_02665 [Proteobacteria bacterium CG1_02_64_396]PJA24238.1 MAG: protein-L-isoaspartate O-methyltransferase [Alphaproteobacteria bacterium CG_4_10_14_0_2_um_filter_63_37]
MNFEQARQNMVQSQALTEKVLNPFVLRALGEVRREDFAPEKVRTLAYTEMHIPFGADPSQVMLTSAQDGWFLQASHIEDSDRILEIGTGTGYLTTLLARLGASVDSIEIDAGLAKAATERLKKAGVENATVHVGDALAPLKIAGPFNVIIVSGSMVEPPAHLLDLLADGGRLLVCMGTPPILHLRVFIRYGQQLDAFDVHEMRVPRLIGVKEPKPFEF